MFEPVIITTLRDERIWLGVGCAVCNGSGIKSFGDGPGLDTRCPYCIDGTRPLTEEEIVKLSDHLEVSRYLLRPMLDYHRNVGVPIKLDGRRVHWMELKV